ncbi:MAG: MBL fold metallo-hydrolase [Chloroflexota bacterium]
MMIQKVTSNVYVETGVRGCNHGFVITREGIVLIDTPQMPSDAIRWREEIAKHGKVRYVINTEPHGDHFSGNCFFEGTGVSHEGTRAAIIASSPEQFKERLAQTAPEDLPLVENFSFRPPAITFSEKLTIHLGDHTFELIHLPGHSPYQLAVFVPEERVIFTSDNVTYGTLAWLHQALPYEWLDSLKRIGELQADVLMPGHGDVCKREFVGEMSAIIQAWIDAVRTAVDRGMSLEEAQEKITFYQRYPLDAATTPAMARQVERTNVAHLYQLFKQN